MSRFFIFFSAIIILLSCRSKPADNTDEFILKPGFKIEVVATEPLIQSPVDMEFDRDGKIWVVELPGYMRDIDGSKERFPDGRIVMLSDSSGDGRLDCRTIIIDSLSVPRAITLVYNGVLYTERTNLWWMSNDGEEKTLVDSSYVTGGNIEHQPNGLLYHIDNWIYSARSNARYRYRQGVWEKEVTSFRGQWGITSDDQGRLIYNDNSNLIRGDALLPNQFIDNPYMEVSNGVGRSLTPDNRIFPIQSTSVNRAYQVGVLNEKGLLINATSSCGPVVYKGRNFPVDYYGDVFVCIPEINAIKRLNLRQDNGRIIANHVYDNQEFLISKDETFRPVNLYNGPGEALYALDLRKGIIQHRAYMTKYLREDILDKGLEKIVGKGRIYKITYGSSQEVQPPVKEEDIILLEALSKNNGYERMRAQKELIFSNRKDLKDELIGMALDLDYPFGQVHAMWTLEGLGILDGAILKLVENNADHPLVMPHLLYLSAVINVEGIQSEALFKRAFEMKSPISHLQLAHVLGSSDTEDALEMWLDLASRYSDDTLFSEALISGIAGKEDKYLSLISSDDGVDTLTAMIEKTIQYRNADNWQAPSFGTVYHDARTSGFELFSELCSSCHMMDGKGQKDLAPPLVNSLLLNDSSEKLGLIILQGLEGPVTVADEKYNMNLMMPGLKSNKDLSDQDIADIVHFVRNAFTSQGTRIDTTDVMSLRAIVRDRIKPFTEQELIELNIY